VGNRIPAYRCRDADHLIVVGGGRELAMPGVARLDNIQDEDVIDNWIQLGGLGQSRLLDGPTDTAGRELRRYYPTSLLLIRLDIIFVWVARRSE